MATPRPRTVAAVLGLLAVAAIAGSLGHPAVIEQWYLWTLDSEDEAVRRAAAEALGRRRSVRAIPKLFELLIDFEPAGPMLPVEKVYFRRPGRLDETFVVAAARDATGHVTGLSRVERSYLANAFALDALIEIGRPALDYAETRDAAADWRIEFIANEIRDAIGIQDAPSEAP